MADGNQITERCCIGDGDHAANLLAGLPARGGFEYCCLAVEVRFLDYSQRDMVSSQKIFSFDARQSQHLRDLQESQSLLAVAFQRERFERAPGNISARGREPLSDFVWNAEGDFHVPEFNIVPSFRRDAQDANVSSSADAAPGHPTQLD
jgi:hypothetical protein